MPEDNKKFWGPSAWATLHVLCMCYESTKSEIFLRCIYSFMKLLVCIICSTHAQSLLQTLPLKNYLQNRDSVFKWSYDFHDKVNKRLNKKSPPYEYVYNFYALRVNNPDFWGKYFWRTIHAFAAGYKHEKYIYFVTFIHSMIPFLPGVSKITGAKALQILPIPSKATIKNNEEIFFWSYNYHVVINKMLDKPSISYSDAKSIYSIQSKNCSKCKTH